MINQNFKLFSKIMDSSSSQFKSQHLWRHEGIFVHKAWISCTSVMASSTFNNKYRFSATYADKGRSSPFQQDNTKAHPACLMPAWLHLNWHVCSTDLPALESMMAGKYRKGGRTYCRLNPTRRIGKRFVYFELTLKRAAIGWGHAPRP